jgi:shikimate dehydrogenase
MTLAACVIGWPIAHSRSPLIHDYWLKQHGIDGTYGIEAVPPEALKNFLRDLGGGRYAGCNVTLPHKERAFAEVRIADATTQRLGAVNTLFRKHSEVWGTNTDGEGFLANVSAHLANWTAAGKSAVILGAGGAARAIVAALVDEGVRSITIVNRSKDRAQSLCTLFGPSIHVAEWQSLPAALRQADMLINTTSLGMKGQPPLPIDLAPLPRSAMVADIVYIPLETSLIETARRRGNPVVPGLGMLLHQAVRGFELWFGVRPKVTSELHALVAADIGRAA